MFDLRYHVASLAAVFVALLLGIFVGVGLSGKGFVSDAERENLQAQIDALRCERDTAVARAASADQRGADVDQFAKTTYPELVAGMLEGKTVGVLFVGSVDTKMAAHVEGAKESPETIAHVGLRAMTRGDWICDTDPMAEQSRARRTLG